MANMLYKTKGNADPQGKSRVYFTCHPADRDKYLHRICEDLWKSHNCVVYYTEDMAAPILEQEKSIDLETNSLFVIPVTHKLLTQPNRAMDQDIPYALQKQIPVLPIMVEQNLDQLYSRPDKFGALQYVSAVSTDETEIAYAEKLQKHVSAVLVGDDHIAQISTVFRTSIFLSYRKKDRVYANALMQQIHKYPEFQDIAIWYDEFLTPGESFQANIEAALASCPLFALLVTPNILEERFGKPNFVMREEYPAAKKAGKPILPFEMLPTDKAALPHKFPGIPPCIDPRNESAFREQLMNAVKQVAPQIRLKTPLRTFYLGVAYWAGINVELNRTRGLALITKAAEAGAPEAMGMLYHVYEKGVSCQVNYREAAKWAQRMTDYYNRKLGESHRHTLTWTGNLAALLLKQGDQKNTLDLMMKIYNLRKQTLGEEHPDTISALSNLALTCSKLEKYQQAQILTERAYQLSCAVQGKDHPETIATLNNLAAIHNHLGDQTKALALLSKVYQHYAQRWGQEHPATLTVFSNIASVYHEQKEYKKATDLYSKLYNLRLKVLGPEHPDTISTINHIAVLFDEMGEHEKGLALKERVYALQCKVLGQEHPNTLLSLNNIAILYARQGNYKKAATLLEQLYDLRCKLLGPTHPRTRVAYQNLMEVRKHL